MQPTAPPSPADALMQHAEQWHHIATPGHVLLARVNAYTHKWPSYIYPLAAAVAVAVAGYFVPPMIGYAIGVPIGKIAGFFNYLAAPSEPKSDPSPELKAITAQIPRTLADPSVYPAFSAIEGALAGASAQLKDGKSIDGCDTTSKITEAWSTDTSAQPNCRMSTDKRRLWVWGAAMRGNAFGPYFALLRKDGDKVTIYNARINDGTTIPLGTYPPVNTSLTPRAVAKDFPELTTTGEKK